MLKFEGICVDIGHKKILRDVSGSAKSWEILAIMGPSGCGKSTLLNSIAGYLPVTKGTITLDGKKMDKSCRSKMSYVFQADLFFEELTLRETLMYTAQLRLPYSCGFKAKKEKVDELISMLGLKDCEHTVVGGPRMKGLSGGEKKRLSIACELIVDPSILLLDEPTSGLDSSTAYSLFINLKKLAHSEGKTIVTSIHQPSSQLFYSFDKLLLMAKGKVAYYGPAKSVMDHFSSMGLNGPEVHNPADFILELVSDNKTRQMLVGKDPDTDDPGSLGCMSLVCPLHIFKQLWRKLTDKNVRRRNHSKVEDGKGDFTPMFNKFPLGSTMNDKQYGEVKDASESLTMSRKLSLVPGEQPRASWWWQYLVLLHRSSRQSRGRFLGCLSLIQTFGFLLACCLVWFQVPYLEDRIRDRCSLLFYFPGSWNFHVTALVVPSFPLDWLVVVKERAGGYYHLSAYFLAKITVEYLLLLVHPTIFIIPLFPIAGLQGFVPFLETWGILLLNCLAVASLVMFFSVVFMNVGKAFVLSMLILIPMFVLGGFLITRLSPVAEVFSRMSIVRYTYRAMVQVNYGPDVKFLCAPEKSRYDVCLAANYTSLNSTYISGPEVVKELGYMEPILLCVGVLILVTVTFTVLNYLTIKCVHGREKPQ